MGVCGTITALARQCGKNVKTGVNPDVYAIAFDDLSFVTGTTEVYTVSVTGIISVINLKAPTTIKFVKIGTTLNSPTIKENFTKNDNGTYDIVKEVSFSLNGIGDVDTNTGVEQFMGVPVALLMKTNSGKWLAFGLNGQFDLKTIAGTVDQSSNGRVLTLSGSDSLLIKPVDPTIIPTLIA